MTDSGFKVYGGSAQAYYFDRDGKLVIDVTKHPGLSKRAAQWYRRLEERDDGRSSADAIVG